MFYVARVMYSSEKFEYVHEQLYNSVPCTRQSLPSRWMRETRERDGEIP